MSIDFHHTAVAQFADKEQAEDCIRKLDHEGFDIRQLTLIGKGFYSQQHVLGFYGVLYRARNRGLRWAVNGGIWGLLFATSYLLLEGYTVLKVFPWLVLYLAACWSFVFGMVGFLWGGFSGIRLRSRQPLRYSTRFRAATYLLIAKGDEPQIDRFRELLDLHLPRDLYEKDTNEPVEV